MKIRIQAKLVIADISLEIGEYASVYFQMFNFWQNFYNME